MKYLLVVGDGMADYPVPELKGKTPLQVANKPNMDWLAAKGKNGLFKTVPDSLTPGSGVAILSVLGGIFTNSKSVSSIVFSTLAIHLSCLTNMVSNSVRVLLFPSASTQNQGVPSGNVFWAEHGWKNNRPKRKAQDKKRVSFFMKPPLILPVLEFEWSSEIT